MRKLLFAFLLFNCLGTAAYSQKMSAILDLNYRMMEGGHNLPDWGIGGQFTYSFTKNFRLAADFSAYFPDDSNNSLDISVNAQYVLPVSGHFAVYPFAGAIISNNSFSADPNNRNVTDYGFNIGAGLEYNFSAKSFLNFDFRYAFLDKEKPAWYDNYGIFRLGYGFRF